MDRIEIVACRSNGEAVFLAFREKWLLGTEMDKMVTNGRLSIHLQKAPKLSSQWGSPH
jgi:predicted DNA-binding ArsR family transcriptional regulator